MITKASIENLKASIDIVDVVSSYISLKKAGVNYKACCPFHDEKTPSFVVSSAKGIYHCFGCSVSGDSISFVMEYEKLNYVEALEKLANNYGVALEYDNTGKNTKFDFSLIESVNDFYIKQLKKSNQLMAYLVDRGLSTQSIDKFKLGYAPSSNDTIKFLKDNFFNLDTALEFAIVSKDENNNLYARFINRITFPIYSNSSKLIGFGGRTLSESDNIAKYLNSPTTKFFNKSRVLYGYDLAKQNIYKQKEIIICEGYLDVIMLHQVGLNNACAVLGTALTPEHLPLLRRGEPSVVLAYDGDKAGLEAAFKSCKLLAQNDFSASVVIFDGGLDPADIAKTKGLDGLQEVFSKKEHCLDFVFRIIASRYDLSDGVEKQKALNEAKEFMASLSAVIYEVAIKKASLFLQVNSNLFAKTNVANHTPTSSSMLEASSINIAQLSIIKTMICNEELREFALKNTHEHIFSNYIAEYRLLKEGEISNTKLNAIYLQDGLKLYDKEEFIKQLSMLSYDFYTNYLAQLKLKKDDYEPIEYMNLVKKLQIKIQKLKNM